MDSDFQWKSIKANLEKKKSEVYLKMYLTELDLYQKVITSPQFSSENMKN